MNGLIFGEFPPLDYAAGEAINTLCTNLTFSGKDIKIIMITSCNPSEGKSFLSMNITRTMAKIGKRVVLVDADLRKSMIHSQYHLKFDNQESKMGLAHYLAGMVDENDVLYQSNIPGVYMVPVGRNLSNPLPLLNSPRFEELLRNLSRKMDYVIVDAPPIGAVIDAAQIAKFCDGILLTVGYNKVHRQELIDAKMQLEQTGCPILGTVLNQVDLDKYTSRKYYKAYYTNYGKTEHTHQNKTGIKKFFERK